MIDVKYTLLRLMFNRMLTTQGLEIPEKLEDGTTLEFINGHDGFHQPYGQPTTTVPADLAPNMKCLDTDVGRFDFSAKMDVYVASRGITAYIPEFTPFDIEFFAAMKKMIGLVYNPSEIFLTDSQNLLFSLMNTLYLHRNEIDLKQATAILHDLHKICDYTKGFKFFALEQNLKEMSAKHPLFFNALNIDNMIKEFANECQSRYQLQVFLQRIIFKKEKEPNIENINNFIKRINEMKDPSKEAKKNINLICRRIISLHTNNRNIFENDEAIDDNVKLAMDALEKEGYLDISNSYKSCFTPQPEPHKLTITVTSDEKPSTTGIMSRRKNLTIKVNEDTPSTIGQMSEATTIPKPGPKSLAVKVEDADESNKEIMQKRQLH